MKMNIKTPETWDREEVVLLVVEYYRTKGLSHDEIAAGQRLVSKILRNRYKKLHGEEPTELFRNTNGIALQTSRIRCLDPETPYNGMKPTLLQRAVFSEYQSMPNKLISEAYGIVAKYYE